MSKRMLIDGTHPEETRVVVLHGNRLEEFDFETSTKTQLKGNIYLAKVTRVEPSLQAAFVEYGGNRHGFLAFSEIHPDYYQIPHADREALLAEEARLQARAAAAADAEADRDAARSASRTERREAEEARERGAASEAGNLAVAADDTTSFDAAEAPEVAEEAALPEDETGPQPDSAAAGPGDGASDAEDRLDDAANFNKAENFNELAPSDLAPAAEAAPEDGPHEEPSARAEEAAAPHPVETIGGDEAEEVDRRRVRPHRHYKIQEVIKRRQVLLVQVVKEERGNKGAALTTYLSLAGRYCVLMPNTARGGGISRKIANPTHRRKLRQVLADLDIPKGMGVIMRTAGVERSKAEIKRDLDFLLRTWDEVRELTLKSTAPCLVYEEGNLIKRAIRDLYVKEIDEVLVDGNEPYQTAKTFMRLLMPSHAKKVKPYREESMPLFYRFQVEGQLAQMHSPIVQLKSGGYIVISPTEALVAIDVNSGRATRERNIEETATKTNLEAADEIARQLRLRDLAGLIVIDFIDMEEGRNQRAVERRLKEAMKNDRARLQVGRISPFGLLELSRQRLRPSLLEASTEVCPRCRGAGHVRSTESTAIHVLRAIEEEGIRHRSERILVRVPTEVALYILNQKREMLHGIEMRYGFRVDIERDDTLIPPDFRLERVKLRAEGEAAPAAPAVIRFQPTPPPEEEEEEEPVAEEEEEEEEAEAEDVAARGEPAPSKGEERPGEEGRGERHRRRRRGRRGAERPGFEPRPREQHATATDEPQPVEIREDAEAPAEDAHQAAPQEARGDGANGEHKRRRRGRRGGRRRGRHPGEGAAPELHASSIAAGGEAPSPVETGEAYGVPDDVSGIPEPPAEPWREPVAEARRAQPAPEPEPRAERSEREEHREPVLSSPEPLSRDEAPKPTRRGWWQRVVR